MPIKTPDELRIFTPLRAPMAACDSDQAPKKRNRILLICRWFIVVVGPHLADERRVRDAEGLHRRRRLRPSDRIGVSGATGPMHVPAGVGCRLKTPARDRRVRRCHAAAPVLFSASTGSDVRTHEEYHSNADRLLRS